MPVTLQVKVTVSPSFVVKSLLEVSKISGGTRQWNHKFAILVCCFHAQDEKKTVFMQYYNIIYSNLVSEIEVFDLVVMYP